MSSVKSTRVRWIVTAGAAALLAACGGGDDDNTARTSPANDPTAAVPASASESSSGLVTYLDALTKADADDKNPVSLKDYTPPKSDDTQPEAVGG